MADTSIAVTPGSGSAVDTRTESTNGNHRQVVVIGDPSTNAGVAPVDVTAGLKVDLGADNDVTVTGTVTANLSSTDNTVLDNIDTSNSSIQTAVQLIDDAIYVDDADWTDGSSKHALVGGIYQSTPQTITDGDVGPINLTANGAVHVSDAGGSLTIDGTVTANLSATDNGVLDDIKVDTEAIETAVEALQAGQLADGHNVTIDNSTGASAVNIQDGGNTITVDGTVTANLSATDNAVLDNIDADLTTVIGHVDGIETLLGTIDADTSNLSVVGGGTEATALRVTIANNSTGVLSVDDNGGALTVDGTVTAELSATDNAVLDDIASDTEAIKTSLAGTLTVTGGGGGVEYTEGDTDTTIVGSAIMWEDASDTLRAVSASKPLPVDIQDSTIAVTQSGTWDEVGINDSGNSITVDNAQLSVVGSGTEATAMRVTIATDSTGVLSIDDNGSAITVDGTVTANLSATDNTVLDNIDTSTSAMATSLGNLDNSVDGNYLNVNMNVAGTDVVSGSGTATGALRVELPTNGTGVIATVGAVTAITNALPAGTNGIGKLTANSGVDIGDVDVTSISAGTNAIGNVGLIGRASGGLSIFRSIDLDETEEEVKATAGQVFSITAFNRTASPLYLKFYNATTANVTVGTTTPVMTFVVPANADSDGAGFIHSTDIGYAFGTAITVACTTGIADNDTGAPGANDCVVNIGYV